MTLYGRDAERERIGELLDGARRSRSGVLVVRGEAGVGKTALLDDARERAGDLRVLAARGIESESHLPFAALQQVLRPVLDLLDALPRPQADALRAALGLTDGPAGERFLVSLCALSLIAEAAEHRPVLCIVDDAHWLDDASADALVFVARRLEAEGVAMLFAARDGELRRFEAPGLPELRLGGLAPEAAAALLESAAGVPPSAEARLRLIEATRGNPLALLELPTALSDAQLAGTEPLFDPLPVGARVEQAFLGRVRQLPEETRAMLLVAAADDAGDLATILRAAEELDIAAEALDAAELGELVEVRAGRLEFRHPLVRSAVYQAAPLSRRQAAHAALAEVLDGEPDRRAWHRAAASVQPDPAVVEELEQVARRARSRSCFPAASLAFERAAELTPESAARARRLAAAADNAWLSGRPERALTLYERARPLANGGVEGIDIDRGRGLIELSLGRPARAYEILAGAASRSGHADAERALYTLGFATLAAAYAGDRSAASAAAALARSIPPGDSVIARFLVALVEGIAAHFSEAFADAAARLRTAVDLAGDAQAAASFAELELLAGAAALFLGDDRAARRFHAPLVGRAREAGAIPLLTHARARLAVSEIWQGDWAVAAADLAETAELARGVGEDQVVGHLLSLLAVVKALQGDEARCLSLVDESRALAVERGLTHVANTTRAAVVILELARGDAAAALAAAREMTLAPVTLWTGAERIEAAVHAGDRETARAWLATFEAWADATPAAWARASAHHCRALLADDEAEANMRFRSALDVGASAVWPFARARTELAYGEFLRRARRRVDAREHLRAAHNRFEALGAAQWAERARRELRASGQTARPRDPSTRDALTARELHVAQFVARGLTNREVAAQLFLSERTVDFHLRNLYRKLGITSRAQLARLDLGTPEKPESDPQETGDFAGAAPTSRL